MRMANIAALLAYQLVAAASCAQPKATVATEPRFEVASVRASGTVGFRLPVINGPFSVASRAFRYTPGRVTCDMPLGVIIGEAFSLESWQLSGPSWLDTDTFDIIATMPGGATKATARLMLRTLLVERFGLKFHSEQKQFPVYDLVVGKSGHKLQEVVPPSGGYRTTQSPGRFSATAIPIGRFADWLSSVAGRPVIDMTDITGAYKIEMIWNPDPENDPTDPRRDAGILSAVLQLGLKLEPRKAAIDILVIDHLDRVPIPN
jgi:uncharacterized protein (TIGR03435 family)